MNIRELLSLNHPVHAVFYVSGVLLWAFMLALAIWFALAAAVDVLTDFVSHRRDRRRDRTLWSDLLN